ncbi:hypothetical protein ACFP81_11450 [Deinococcus lacus]|uniref:Uncharacterized protein n=1 Tax=Deinococcus lacus TaxID=392561 RepID=A0ABW1YAW0_9DEIO
MKTDKTSLAWTLALLALGAAVGVAVLMAVQGREPLQTEDNDAPLFI